MADRRVQEKLALDILVVTSTHDLHALKGVLGEKGVKDDPVTGVSYAGTPLHGAKVYGLGGVKTSDGKIHSMMAIKSLPTASPAEFGSYPIEQGAVSDPTAMAAWWYLANGQYAAVKDIAKLAKKSGPVGEEVSALMERVHGHLQQRFDAVPLPISSIDSYEQAESLLADLEAAGLREFSDQEKALKSALKEAGKDAALADELKARAGYQKCLGMLAGDRPKEATQAVAGLRQLGEMLPGTVYGKRAQQRAAVYGGMH